MSNSTERVAVVATALSELRPAWDRVQHVDLISETVNNALLGSGLDIRDIGFVVNSGSDVLDGRSISNCGFLGAMGAHHKEESRVEEDGLFGAMYAVNKVAGGAAKAALIVGYSKPSESIVENYYRTIAEPFYQRPVGLNKAVASGILASQYLHETDATEEDLAEIAARAWTNAEANTKVPGAKARTAQEILAGDLVAAPLRELALSRPVDGAVALIIVTESIARKLTPNPVWITGMGSAMESQFLSERAPGRLEAAEVAAAGAIRRSGRSGASSFDLAEVSAVSAAEEAMVVEALGIAPRGKAASAYGGDVDINPSGGALPADPIMATGLVRLHEAVDRLSGKVEGSSATSALVHGAGGIGSQTHSVFTLEV
jgi:acetyl-CoA C-acetyltransferase